MGWSSPTSFLPNVKLHLGKRLLRQVERHEAWWAQNRPSAPDLFAREFRDTLELISAPPGAGVAWPTQRRPTLRRILMPKTRNHVYFRVDSTRGVIYLLGVWRTPQMGGPQL